MDKHTEKSTDIISSKPLDFSNLYPQGLQNYNLLFNDDQQNKDSVIPKIFQYIMELRRDARREKKQSRLLNNQLKC